jgi:cellulose synthase (UDP-forming)
MNTSQPHIQHPSSNHSRPQPADEERSKRLRLLLLRALIATNLILGLYYLSWRYVASINWAAWPIALALLAAETYSYLDTCLFGLTIWRMRQRGEPPPPPPGATVDVFITCYNEPVELVRETAVAAREIHWSHRTYILDDGNAPEMRAMAQEEGVGYIVRSTDWQGKERHAKAGNINNALFQTQGEFILILDADQIPSPEILHRTLGYFGDPRVAFVQTPQWFYNVPPGDPFGSQAPLFYGPIQQGKDGWNAAFFCGSNAVLRREALMQVGVSYYARELERRVRVVLRTAGHLLRAAERRLTPSASAGARAALSELQTAVLQARGALRRGASVQEVTWEFQRRAEAVSRMLVREDLARIKAELAEIPGLDASDLPGSLFEALDDEEALSMLARRESSPLAAIEVVRQLLLTVDVDRVDEAQPVMPLARISVTEDMATAMRLHALGWRSVYHHGVLARGLAPEDLRSALQQRLRWAQGTIQVMLRENPLFLRGLSVGQKLMYFATMWGYLSGFVAVVYLVAPVLYLLFGILPVRSYAAPFFSHLVPYLLINQLLFIVIGWGLPTWRGQQYSLALFPLWIKAITSAIGNVYFGRKLGFVVTPKTRQGGVHLSLIWPQLAAIVLLNIAIIWGLGRLALGLTEAGVPILVNVFWACYDLVALSVVLHAATYRPATVEIPLPTEPAATMAELHGRPGAGQA